MNEFRLHPPAVKMIESLQFPHIHPVIFDNGVHCYRLPRRELGVIRLDVFWPFGTRDQAHIYEARTTLALSLSGTDKLTAEQITEEFEYMGSETSFDTQLLNSGFHLKSNQAHFIPSFRFFMENFRDAVYPVHEIENFKQIEQAGILRKMQTPRYWAHRLCYESLYPPGSPMAAFADPFHLEALQQASLTQFHHKYLNLRQAVFFLSGDVDDETWNLFSELIAQIPGEGAAMAAETQTGQAMPSQMLQKKSMEHAQQVSLFMGKRIPAQNEREIHQIALLNMLLGGFFGSRLMQEIREEKGLTYGIGSYLSQSTDGNVWCISGEMNSANTVEAWEAIKLILDSMKNNPPGGSELDRAKRYYCGQLRTSFDGPFAMSGKIRNLLVRGYTYKHYEHAMRDILNTTTDDLCQLADNYLSPETFNTVLAGNIT